MCFFKKNKKIVIDTKFKLGDFVAFKHYGERTVGWIYNIYPKDNSETIYDIQIGGQCPAVVNNVKESEITLAKPH